MKNYTVKLYPLNTVDTRPLQFRVGPSMVALIRSGKIVLNLLNHYSPHFDKVLIQDHERFEAGVVVGHLRGVNYNLVGIDLEEDQEVPNDAMPEAT